MIKNSRTQQGSAHVVIIILLVIAVLGLLGFVFWHNFIRSNATPAEEQNMTTSNETTDKGKVEQKTYTNDDLSFNYPVSGWVVEETRYGEGASLTPELKSSDYQQTGMGVDKGAIISVSMNEKSTTIDKEYANLQESASVFGLEDLQKTIVSGKSVITYHSAYEGIRYHTVFIHEGKAYDVIYMYEYEGEALTHLDTYNLVTSSLKFKE